MYHLFLTAWSGKQETGFFSQISKHKNILSQLRWKDSWLLYWLGFTAEDRMGKGRKQEDTVIKTK